MTTIAYKNGILAADSAVTINNMYAGKVNKITYDEEKKVAIGISGNMFVSTLVDKIVAYMNGELEKPPEFEDTDILIVKDGKVYVYQGEHYPVLLESDFASIGSGSQIAMGAMAAGATAEEAVSIASEMDVFTRKPINVIKIPC